MGYVTTEQLRQKLVRKIRGRTQADVCRLLVVKPQNLSVMLQGAPIYGKVLAWLGYEKVEGLYRPARRK